MARIWLHIGLHKTGTSAMQSWCTENADDLLRKRILYVRVRKNLPACAALATELIRRSPEGDVLVRNVLQQIEDHWERVDDVVISSESFSHFGPASIEPLVDQLHGHEIFVLIWLRRQDRFAEAMYKQTVKWNGGRGAIEDFVAESMTDHMYYDRLLDDWQEVFPQATIKPQIYAEAVAGQTPDSIASFLTAIGRPDLIPADSAQYRTNLSPRSELIRHYSDIPPDQGKALRQANRQLMSEYGEQASGRGDLMSPVTAASLMRQYARSNAEVLRKWFPERAELFPEGSGSTSPSAHEDDGAKARFDQLFAERLKG